MLDYERRVRTNFAGTDWIEWLQPEFGVEANSKPHKHRTDAVAREWKKCAAETAMHAMVHAKMAADFALMSGGLGLYSPASKFAWHLGNPKFTYFRDYFEGRLMDEVFGIAQHHGIPTLLLDWSLDPYVAAYFASGGSDADRGDEIEIWALRWSYLNSDAGRVKRVTVARGLTPYLDAQKGLFTWCPMSYSYRVRHGEYPAHDDLIREDSAFVGIDQPLRRITMRSRGRRGEDNITRLRQLLWREGMSPADVMPSFDNIARALRVSAPWSARSGVSDVAKYQQFARETNNDAASEVGTTVRLLTDEAPR